MEIVILWLGLSILAGVLAANKGRSGFGFFLLSVILSPLIGLIAALVVQRDDQVIEQSNIQQGTMKKCLFCAEAIKAEAVVCRYCGKDLPEPEQDVGTMTLAEMKKKGLIK